MSQYLIKRDKAFYSEEVKFGYLFIISMHLMKFNGSLEEECDRRRRKSKKKFSRFRLFILRWKIF